MSFPLYFTYRIRHHSCLNTQARRNSHPCCCSGITRVLEGERDLNQMKKGAESPKHSASVCLSSQLQDCQVTSPHFTSLRTVTAPGSITLDFLPNKHPFAIHLPKTNAANSAPEVASELHPIL